MLKDKITLEVRDELEERIRKDAERSKMITTISLEICDLFAQYEITKETGLAICKRVSAYMM